MAQCVFLKLFFLNLVLFCVLNSQDRVEQFLLKMNRARTDFAAIKDEYETLLNSLSATKKFGDVYIAKFKDGSVLLDIKSGFEHNFYYVEYVDKKIKLKKPLNFRFDIAEAEFDKIGKISRAKNGTVTIRMFDHEGKDLFVSHGSPIKDLAEGSPRSAISLESQGSSHSNDTVLKNESMGHEIKPSELNLDYCHNFDVVMHGFL